MVTAPRRDSVQSLDRAFDLLEALASGGELGVTELANRTGLVPSTVHRLLATLAKRGYVTQSPGSGRYLLGYKVSEIASGLEQRLSRLRSAARPHLERISQETGETVNLVVLDADRVIYVDQVEGTRRVRMFTAVGTAALAHTTGSGKAILAHRPPGAAASLYGGREPLERLTPSTLVTVAALEDDFARIRARGATRSTRRSTRPASAASPRRCSTRRGVRWPRSASRARRRGSSTATRAIWPACCCATRARPPRRWGTRPRLELSSGA